MAEKLEVAKKEEVGKIFSLYEDRVRWMDRNGIQQWNTDDYLLIYPLEYFGQMQEEGKLYALKDPYGTIVGAVVLTREDSRWDDDAPAIYLHNHVTDPGVRGMGQVIIEQAGEIAAAENIPCLRLDCARDNAFLNVYYESLGFEDCGICEDGPYVGIRRQKKIRKEGELTFRRAGEQDMQAVYELICRMEGRDLPLSSFSEIYQKQVESGTFAMVLCESEDQGLVGLLNLRMEYFLHHVRKVARVEELLVHSSVRSQGIGTQLLQKAEEIARENQCTELVAAANIKRQDAFLFYTHFGMEKDHVRFSKMLE